MVLLCACSIVFQKNQVLFNIDIAKDYAKSSNFVIMVEGYFDVISLHEAGIKNVVASMGTSVTINQLLAAASLSNSGTIVLLLDGDEAGLLASERVTKILEKFESELKKRQQLVIEGQAALPILPKPVAKPKPWKKLLDDSKDQIQSPVEQSITVRVASLANVTSFAEGNHLVPKTLSSDQVSNIDDESRSQLYANMKIKDCADICEVFTSHDAKKIMREVVNAATALKTIRWKRGDQLVSDD